MTPAHLPIQSLAAGDAKAFRIIYDYYYRRVAVMCWNMIHDRERVKDCIQEIFINLWERRELICTADNFGHYFMRTAYLRALRHVKPRFDGFPIDEFCALSVDGYEPIYENDLFNVYKKEAPKVVSGLGDRQRQIYLLSKDGGMDAPAISRSLNIKEQTVHNVLTTVMKRIRSRVVKFI